MSASIAFSIPTIENGIITADLHWDESFENMPLVVFCHGYKGFKDWGCWNRVASYFASRGMMFLKFNFSLNGTTPDNLMEFDDLDAFARNTYSREVADLHSVLNFVSHNKSMRDYGFNGRDLFLVGHSRGGGIAILGSVNPAVKKLITWASVSDFESRFPQGEDLETWKNSGVWEVYNARTAQVMPHHYSFYEDFQANRAGLDIASHLAAVEIPFLIIHAEDDESVAVEEAITLNALAPYSELLLLESGGHTFGTSHPCLGETLPESMKEVCEASVAFLFGDANGFG